MFFWVIWSFFFLLLLFLEAVLAALVSREDFSQFACGWSLLLDFLESLLWAHDHVKKKKTFVGHFAIETFWHLTQSDHDFHNLDFMGSSWLPSLSLDIRIVLAFATLHNYHISYNMLLVAKDLGHKVKPRNVTWYSHFFLFKYYSNRWKEMFRLLKNALSNIAKKLHPYLLKRNTKYWLAIPIEIHVSCALYKLTHGANILLCSKWLAMEKNIVALMLWKFVKFVNIVFKSFIRWPKGREMKVLMTKFK